MSRLIAAALAALLLAGPALAGVTDLVIRDFVVAQKIDQNEPVGVSDDLPHGQEAAYVFARFDNIGEPIQITFVWFFDGKEVRRTNQTIGKSSGWRSYTQNRMKPGKWRVALLGPDGQTLADRDFVVR